MVSRTADERCWPGITKGRSHAVDSTRGSSNRCGRPLVAGESLHSNAGNHKINPECRRSHSCRFVDTECYWTLSFLLRYPHWTVKDGGGTTPRRIPSPHKVAQLPRTPAPWSPLPADLIPGGKLPPAPEGAGSVKDDVLGMSVTTFNDAHLSAYCNPAPDDAPNSVILLSHRLKYSARGSGFPGSSFERHHRCWTAVSRPDGGGVNR